MLIKKLFIGTPTILFVGRATKQPVYDTSPMYMGTSQVMLIFCHQLEISNIQYLVNFHAKLNENHLSVCEHSRFCWFKNSK